MKCCICGKVVNGYLHNAYPVKEGQCCEDCNNKLVLPFRIFLASKERSPVALVLKPKFEAEIVKPKEKYFTLPELQKAVDGYIEIAPIPFEDSLIVVNEEGLIKRYPPNLTGLFLYEWKFMGNILIVPKSIFEAPEEE